MINIVKNYLWMKIHKLNTLIGCSDDSWSQAQNKYIVKNRLLRDNYRWLLLLLRSAYKASTFFQKLTSYPHILFNLKSFLWKGPLIVKVRKKKSSIRFCLNQFLCWNTCTFRSSFHINSANKFNRWSCSKMSQTQSWIIYLSCK